MTTRSRAETEVAPQQSNQASGGIVLPRWFLTVAAPLIVAFSAAAFGLMWRTYETATLTQERLDVVRSDMAGVKTSLYTADRAALELARRDDRIAALEREVGRIESMCKETATTLANLTRRR